MKFVNGPHQVLEKETQELNRLMTELDAKDEEIASLKNQMKFILRAVQNLSEALSEAIDPEIAPF